MWDFTRELDKEPLHHPKEKKEKKKKKTKFL